MESQFLKLDVSETLGDSELTGKDGKKVGGKLMKKKNHLVPFCRAPGSHISPHDGSGCSSVTQTPPPGHRETTVPQPGRGGC